MYCGCTCYCINFFFQPGKVKVCRQVTHSSQLRDTAWASNSCVLTFSTIGIWPEGADGTDVNACERSNGSKVMATGDDFGKVKLYSYPVKQPKVNTTIMNEVHCYIICKH